MNGYFVGVGSVRVRSYWSWVLGFPLYPNLIENIFSNITDNETLSGNIMIQITDHFRKFLIVKHEGITYKNLSYI